MVVTNKVAESYRALLPFIRTQFVDEITTTRVNDSAWADGVFVPTEEVLANLDKQAQALLSSNRTKSSHIKSSIVSRNKLINELFYIGDTIEISN